MSFQKKNKLVLISALVLFFTGIIFIGIQLSDTNYLLVFYRKYISVVFTSCLCLILVGAGYVLQQFDQNKKARAFLIALSLLLTAICVLTILEYLFHFNAEIGRLFVSGRYSDPKTYSFLHSQMLPATAIVYLFLGLALIGFCTKIKFIHILSQYFLHVSTVLCSILFIGFAYGGISLVNIQTHALNYLWLGGWVGILSIAASFRHPSLGLTNLFSGNLVGNKMARRLFLMMAISILVFGLVKVKYLNFAMWQYDTSISLFVFCILVAALPIIWHTADWLNKVDLERIKAEYELKILNAELGKRVEERTAELSDLLEKYKESELKFRSLVENFIVGVYIHQHGEIVYANPRLLEESGYSETELTGRPLDEFIYKDDLNLVKRIIGEREKGQIDTIRYEARLVKKDGKPIWFEIFGSKTVYEGAPALMGTMVNITERMVAEDEIHRLSRLYQFVSSINESMLKAENADQVYADACRIAVEVGRFQMAWIGTYDKKNDRITPVSWSGHEDGFFEKIKVESMKVSESAIPSARAIRERAQFYYNDIANDSDISPEIKHEMVNRGYLSGVSFPIFVDGEIVAAMVLLMSEPFFFNEQEIELLHNVTDNIMYALDKIKIQALQNQSEANLRSIFDTTEVNYMLLDSNYDIVAINQQSKDWQSHLTGVLFEKGVNVIDGLLPEKREPTRALFDKVIQGNHSEDYETSYLKDGVYTHFLANVKPIHDGKKTIGICITGINITQQKKLTLELLNHVEAIEEQNKKLREIGWIQSHTVRAPLARMMGLIALFANHEASEEEKQQMATYLVDSARELDKIINDISDKVY